MNIRSTQTGSSLIQLCVTLALFAIIIPMLCSVYLISSSALQRQIHSQLTHSEWVSLSNILKSDLVSASKLTLRDTAIHMQLPDTQVIYNIKKGNLVRKIRRATILRTQLDLSHLSLVFNQACIQLEFKHFPTQTLCRSS